MFGAQVFIPRLAILFLNLYYAELRTSNEGKVPYGLLNSPISTTFCRSRVAQKQLLITLIIIIRCQSASRPLRIVFKVKKGASLETEVLIENLFCIPSYQPSCTPLRT